MIWVWIVLGILLSIPLAACLGLFGLYVYLRLTYSKYLCRIFQERPLFIIPRGNKVDSAEEVDLHTPDGLTLKGAYLRTSAPERRGVLLFGIEFGSNRWSCVPYCEILLANGFDVFSFEPRGQGESPIQPGYDPLQWITNHEVIDFRTAIAYLKCRPDADARGIGFFGISKGGGSGLIAAVDEPYVRCFATDGIFATYSTVLPYMRKWVSLYSPRKWLQTRLPDWYYGAVARPCLRTMGKLRNCRYLNLEDAMPALAPRPLFMIHGGNDTYIKPEMAQKLFDLARGTKEFWLVDKAKHNQAIHLAGEEYKRRVLEFFMSHLEPSTPTAAARDAAVLVGK